jgi:hypothetical protein
MGGLALITRYKKKGEFDARWSGGLLSFTLNKNGRSCLLLGGLVVLSQVIKLKIKNYFNDRWSGGLASITRYK